MKTEDIRPLIDSGEGINVEFKVRVPSKVHELTEEICAFANAEGGYVLIGVENSGKVVGAELDNDKRSAIQNSISEISPALHCELYPIGVDNQTIWVIEVPSGKDKPYIFSGSIYIREGANSQKLRTVEQMRSFFQECNKIFFDHIPCRWFDIYNDADEQAVKDFRLEAGLSPTIPDKQIFDNLELFTDEGVAKNGAAMFFGKDSERKFPHAITRCVLFKGTNKVYIIDDKVFGGPLYQQYTKAMAWLESKLQVASGIPRMRKAMKEAKLPDPEFRTEGMFTIVFKRTERIVDNDDPVNGTVNGTVNQVLKLIKQYPGLNSLKVSDLIGKSLRTTKRHLKSLINLGLIEFRGAPKTGGYYVKQQ